MEQMATQYPGYGFEKNAGYGTKAHIEGLKRFWRYARTPEILCAGKGVFEMTVVAMWCRHAGDDLIGIGDNIPWNVPSDTKHFLDVVSGQTVVCGRIT